VLSSLISTTVAALSSPPPQPQPLQPNADIDHSSDDSVDPRFEWDEAYIAYAEAKAAAQWGELPQAPADPKQAEILASLNAQRLQRLK
jgi:hypothetical protein